MGGTGPLPDKLTGPLPTREIQPAAGWPPLPSEPKNDFPSANSRQQTPDSKLPTAGAGP
jgi:hypothetical protein